MLIKKLSGHSGCDISLHYNEEECIKFVRKTSSNRQYNVRLERQSLKQTSFNHESIKSPQIFRKGYKEGLFYFDMEFIKGNTFSEICVKRDISSIDVFFDKIFDYLSETDYNFIMVDYTELISEKLNSICSVLEDNYYQKYVDYILDFDWSNIINGRCHGDLTFENIIISSNDVYFIDFLDSPIDTRLLDFSKILQDLIYFWSWRNYERKPIIKNINFFNKIRKSQVYLENSMAIKKIMALNMLRIVPYTKDLRTRSYIERCLDDICEV